MILNSNRLRTFEDARLEVVTFVEAKFGLRTRDSKPSDTSTRGHSDPMDVDAVNSLSSGKGKGSSSCVMGVFKCGGAHFQPDCNARKNTGKQSYGKGKQSKSWSESEGKGKSRTRFKVPKDRPSVKHRKLVSQVLKTRNQRYARKLRNLHRHVLLTPLGAMVGIVTNGMMAGLMNGMMIGVLWGWHEGWEQTYDTSASSFSLGGLDVSATSSPMRFEWVKRSLDTRAAGNTFPLNFGPERARDGRFYRTASGEWIPDRGSLAIPSIRRKRIAQIFEWKTH